MSGAENEYVMSAEDWADFEDDFAIVVEMMSQSLDGRPVDYQAAQRAVRKEAEEMRVLRQSHAV